MLDFATQLKRLLLAGVLVLVPIQYGVTANGEPKPLETGFRQMYNLEFAAAHHTFETWKQQHPDDPLGAAANAAAYLFDEFDRLRILEADFLTDGKNLEDIANKKPDPAIKAAFETELSTADALAEKVLSRSAEDRDALFAKMLTDGLRGDYAALVEKKKRDALGFLKSSRLTAQRLILIDPEYSDAYLAIGVENYVLGLKPAPTRWVLRLSGSETSREKGIASLKITADKGRYLAPYARILLTIAAFRDQDIKTAKGLLAGLAREFPQNRLYRLELSRLQS
jgi:hypothetical protein